jgi:multidrug efflux pump subunit AcrA (membrane-fusion protein)
MKRRGVWIAFVTLVVLAGSGLSYWKLRASDTPAASAGGDGPIIPTATVVRGPLALDVHATGELRAARSMMMAAPSVGGTLRIITLLPTGAFVKTGDVIVELDPSDQEYQLEQAKSQLEEAEQIIVKRRADLQVQTAEQEVALLTARFDVRRAELDARMDRDLISANDFAKRELALEQARQQLARLEADAKTRLETDKAALMLVEEGRAKAELAMTRAQENIASLTMKAPMDGLVVVRENRDASGGMFYSGMTLPELRSGDNTFAGRPIADVFDLSGMTLKVKVNELDRANVAVGQSAEVSSNGVPGEIFPGTISSVAGLVGTSDWWDTAGPSRQFDATLTLNKLDPRLRPGTTVEAILKGKTIDDVLQVPLQAVRQKNGKPIVFVQTPQGFETREVKVTYRTESRAGLEGIPEGAVVALVDPTQAPAAGNATAAPTGSVK